MAGDLLDGVRLFDKGDEAHYLAAVGALERITMPRKRRWSLQKLYPKILRSRCTPGSSRHPRQNTRTGPVRECACRFGQGCGGDPPPVDILAGLFSGRTPSTKVPPKRGHVALSTKLG